MSLSRHNCFVKVLYQLTDVMQSGACCIIREIPFQTVSTIDCIYRWMMHLHFFPLYKK